MGSISDGTFPRDMGHPTVHAIFDIRSDRAGLELKREIHSGLNHPQREKTLPTLLLYNERGLKLFEDITYLEEYYLTGEETRVLEQYANSIAQCIPNGALIIELGSGNLRKIRILLDALEKSGKLVSYFALDLMKSELERTLAQVPPYKFVECYGLYGTYDDALDYLKRPEIAVKPKVILSMGSSIGNFNREEAVGFVKQFTTVLGRSDRLVIAVDACQEPDKVFHAYNDREGLTHEFVLNGLQHANELLGYQAFKYDEWFVIGEYNEKRGCHEAFVVPKTDVKVDGMLIKKGERVHIESSYKYSNEQAGRLWNDSGVTEAHRWTNKQGNYSLHMLKKSNMAFQTKPEEYAAHPVPSLTEWDDLWAMWDKVTRQMIPDNELLTKPIELRNACIFYLGHIPTFLDMKLVESTKGKPTEPAYFYGIFERGIDPDVDNPEHCHAHSEIPDEWPQLEAILQFQEDVRQHVRDLYVSGKAYEDGWVGRTIWLGFEHEIMHMETLLYMLLQSEWTRPPPGTKKPDFEQLAVQAGKQAVENQWFDIPEQTITLGMEDPETADGPLRHFGWDVEKPSYTVNVKAFKAKARPITNGEYARYLCETGKSALPASWTTVRETNGLVNGHTNGHSQRHDYLNGKAVRTVFGPVPLKFALDWPMSASYDELNGCARYMGGRVPTLEEARSIYFHTDGLKKKEASNALGETIPAVNGHLVNNGVEESPPSRHSVNGASGVTPAGLDPNHLFVNLDEANVGFKHWHPMPVTQNGSKLAGQAEMGGLWEWTSSTLKKHEGFQAMKLYPAYSADFYDDKHNVVLGGSWATHPRLAGRKTFVNWYQRNYPYVWAGARMVKDA